MRFWFVFSLGNAMLALLPLLLSRLGHRATGPMRHTSNLFSHYLLAVVGLLLTRLIGVNLMQLIGQSIGGAGLFTFVSLTLVVPTLVVAIALWALVQGQLKPKTLRL